MVPGENASSRTERKTNLRCRSLSTYDPSSSRRVRTLPPSPVLLLLANQKKNIPSRKAKNELNLSFLIGVESEFILLEQTNPTIEAVNNHGWSNSPALPSGSVETKVLEEIAHALSAAGIELQMYHAEAAPGQYEVVTGPLGPLQAADALVHTRETIYNVASKHGLRATFAPRVYMDSCNVLSPLLAFPII